MAIFKVKLG